MAARRRNKRRSTTTIKKRRVSARSASKRRAANQMRRRRSMWKRERERRNRWQRKRECLRRWEVDLSLPFLPFFLQRFLVIGGFLFHSLSLSLSLLWFRSFWRKQKPNENERKWRRPLGLNPPAKHKSEPTWGGKLPHSGLSLTEFRARHWKEKLDARHFSSIWKMIKYTNWIFAVLSKWFGPMGVMGSPKERPLWVGRDPTKVWEPPLNNTFLSVCDKKNGPTGFDFGRFESTTIETGFDGTSQTQTTSNEPQIPPKKKQNEKQHGGRRNEQRRTTSQNFDLLIHNWFLIGFNSCIKLDRFDVCSSEKYRKKSRFFKKINQSRESPIVGQNEKERPTTLS